MKAIASDFDGTLFFLKDGEGYISADTLQAIRRFQQEGNLFGICTGRPLEGVEGSVQGRIAFDFYILNNGAVLLDQDKKILAERTMKKSTLQAIYDLFHENSLHIALMADGMIYAIQKVSKLSMAKKFLPSLADYKGNKPYGLAIRMRTEQEAEDAADKIQKKFGAEVQAWQNQNFVDIVAKGCSKGAALKEIKQLYQLQEIAGIGDSYNDLPMLKEADVSFTFSTSPEIVKKEADHLVEDVAEALSLL